MIEVVLALGVVSFCLVTLIGLLTIGLQAGRDSSDTIQAADMASWLVSVRRSAPTNALPAAFPLPALNQASSGEVYLSDGGAIAPAPGAAFRLGYGISTNASAIALLSLRLSWPASANPITQPQLVKGRYELATCIPLP